MARWMTAKEKREQEELVIAELELAKTEDVLERTHTRWSKQQLEQLEAARKMRG